jgi:hypothetical protein
MSGGGPKQESSLVDGRVVLSSFSREIAAWAGREEAREINGVPHAPIGRGRLVF